MIYRLSKMEENSFINIKDRIPDKNKNLICIDSNNSYIFCFRCACSVQSCMDFRCSLTGNLIYTNIVKWKYEND